MALTKKAVAGKTAKALAKAPARTVTAKKAETGAYPRIKDLRALSVAVRDVRDRAEIQRIVASYQEGRRDAGRGEVFYYVVVDSDTTRVVASHRPDKGAGAVFAGVVRW